MRDEPVGKRICILLEGMHCAAVNSGLLPPLAQFWIVEQELSADDQITDNGCSNVHCGAECVLFHPSIYPATHGRLCVLYSTWNLSVRRYGCTTGRPKGVIHDIGCPSLATSCDTAFSQSMVFLRNTHTQSNTE